MTWFYVCSGCGKLLAHGKQGKGSVQKIEVFGECCYDIEEEIKEINEWRLKTGKDAQDNEGVKK